MLKPISESTARKGRVFLLSAGPRWNEFREIYGILDAEEEPDDETLGLLEALEPQEQWRSWRFFETQTLGEGSFIHVYP